MPDAGLWTGGLVKMAGGSERSDIAAESSGGGLDRLMQTEQRLQDVLAQAEEQAVLIRADALAAVEAAEGRFEQEAADTRKALEDRVTVESQAELLRIEREYQAQKAALEGIADTQVRELADMVVRRLWGQAPAPADMPEPTA